MINENIGADCTRWFRVSGYEKWTRETIWCNLLGDVY